MTKELEALKARNAELEERIEKLENQLNPKPLPASNRGPRDYTEGFSMPPSAMRAMVEALPGAVVRELAVDARKPNPVTGGPNPPPTKQRATPNWVDERPLESPPGQKHIDALVSHQDRIDKAERAYALAKAIALGRKGNE
jgi:hypothetical protein